MSKSWGGDYVVTEHRDLQANTMAVDVTGNYVLLAGRRYLAVKNLDEESAPLRKFNRTSKYEVGSAEWNPHLTNGHLCAISSNNRVEILNLAGKVTNDLQPLHSLRAHTRVVSDLHWHPKDSDILATCSIDTYIHIWDIRDQRKPSLSLSAVAGASQVRWNISSPNILATAHDGDVKIWDQRKGNIPFQYIAAHLSKIHGLDWCPFQQNQLATSSQDCTVKIFDMINPRRAESILTTNSPVWRARYTPFGEGLVTIVVPQLRRGENSLLLWNTSNFSSPIYTFVGHTDVVLEFQWRHPKSEKNDFELVTWSKDQCLRIFKIPSMLKKLCGHDMDDGNDVYTQYSGDDNLSTTQSVQDLQLHDSNIEQDFHNMNSAVESVVLNQESEASKLEKEAPSPTQPITLQQEFSLMNLNLPNIEVNTMDATERSCTITASSKTYKVVLKVNFPGNYPCNVQPTFQFCPGTTIDNATMTKVLKILKQTAQQRVKKSRTCLESCLKQLVTILEQLCHKDEAENGHIGYHMQLKDDFINSNEICSNYHDAYIPFPRTSGAKFCSVGTLVCFGRSIHAKKTLVKSEGITPRALSALGSNINNGGHFMNMYSNTYVQPKDNISISSFYFQDRMSRRTIHTSNKSHGKQSYKNHHSVVTVYDASSLFFVNKELAERYIINTTDIPAMCHHNADVAASLERPDLVQAWYLAALVISQPLTSVQNAQVTYQTPDIDASWSLHPFGQNLIHSLIQHYANQSDIQMAAMLSCAFSCRYENSDPTQNRHVSKSVNVSKLFSGKWWLKPGGSPYHTIHPADTSLEGWNFPNLKQNRSNSWSESLDGLSAHDTPNEFGRNVRLLDGKNTSLYDVYKKAYAEILHRWRLLDVRAQVLKHVSSVSCDVQKSIEFQSECLSCNKSCKGPQCSTCKRLVFQCVICHISIRGPSNFCIACGHGGHTHHLAAWFAEETVCPAGCGCLCLQENTILLKV
ncbi:hypothetical protein QAD02_023503 [Eretmocerus hayati]|uniref:Uncharacterized protein n=1 Tax=Eretmocerus hayati TaxID=131215 RepID=A0ACC2PYI3_9HYME|nr:hypothetical protein QAD02_023503 [Eretmocerus hayati]